MNADDSADLGSLHRGGSHLNCPSSGMYTTSQPEKVAGMTMSSIPMCKSSNGLDSFFGSGWDTIVSLPQDVEFKGSSMASHSQIDSSPYAVGALENHEISNSSHLVQYPSDPSLVDLVSKLPSFGSGSFSEMVSSFVLPECCHVANANCTDYRSNKEGGTKKTSTNSRKGTDHGAVFQEDRQISDEGTVGSSPNGKKRRRVPDSLSQFDPIQSAEAELRKDVSRETLECPKEQDEKKHKTEQSPGANFRGKVMGKQSKDRSHNGEDLKEDYIHVRAKRGQATNSHSLAERVRREKISERMRFLQDLVPGCNKFLSMKLATVNPELNIDIERILSQDILHARGGSAAILRFDPGVSSSHPHQFVTQQGALPAIKSTDPQLPSMHQIPSVWDDELQSVLQMGFVSNPSIDSLGPNGKCRS
ncbi:hypothetical protein HHK36_009726 [Tetracentron sinense]|uniref:BHLH domain-containing protein n=1 Tax=Tetracentron sinense TaxID=13715 RepID=A0A835DLJ1_TETSI|nr:hypothetical protein HHK36_009726 [Tetracentron sinense]